jgi:hypothetical protein
MAGSETDPIDTGIRVITGVLDYIRRFSTEPAIAVAHRSTESKTVRKIDVGKKGAPKAD